MKVLQRNCAAYLKLRNWQWWRLFTKVGARRHAGDTQAHAGLCEGLVPPRQSCPVVVGLLGMAVAVACSGAGLGWAGLGWLGSASSSHQRRLRTLQPHALPGALPSREATPRLRTQPGWPSLAF